ncbi:hypothetical protein M569_13001 [Genlisea aurea]|uniref:Ubiquitin-like protease family profile domain-containing protein n=1 Tax=Genlisea aurea TaxID=192259 RepID=S8DPR3_9LAMI|nr:hypothetical protein M569_13001 [Genlisea aurea]
MAKQHSDEKILSYNDVILRQSDLDILDGPHFLNDRIIEFYFAFLTSSHPTDQILLIPPAVSFWIKECPDPATLADFLRPLDLPRRKLILLPVNDNTDVELAEGGSHWSLLAFYRDADPPLFVHHDSCGGMNRSEARRAYRAVASHTESGAEYVECPSMPTQVNGYDCGLYVTAVAAVICEWYAGEGAKDSEGLWFSVVGETITPSRVSKMRRDLLDLVKGLIAKK